MAHDIRKYLFDIDESVNSIEQFLGDTHDFAQYVKNKLLRRGVERELEIIGEAMSKLITLKPDIKITNPQKIIDLRNWLIHGYDKVDNVIIWGILSKDLQVLKEDIKLLIKEFSAEP